jgi:hypothetical protein
MRSATAPWPAAWRSNSSSGSTAACTARAGIVLGRGGGVGQEHTWSWCRVTHPARRHLSRRGSRGVSKAYAHGCFCVCSSWHAASKLCCLCLVVPGCEAAALKLHGAAPPTTYIVVSTAARAGPMLAKGVLCCCEGCGVAAQCMQPLVAAAAAHVRHLLPARQHSIPRL